MQEELKKHIQTICPFDQEGALSACYKSCELYNHSLSKCSFAIFPEYLKSLIIIFKNMNKNLEDISIHIQELGIKTKS